MPLQYAVSGGCGFIGAALVRHLVAQGHAVTVLLRPDSDPARIADLPAVDRLVFRGADDAETVRNLKSQAPDVLIHCAWRGVGSGDRNEPFQITENLFNTLAFVDLAAAVGCRQWIGLGSQAEYGNQNCRLDEGAPTQPTTVYGKAKLAAGIAALALCSARSLAGVWVRIFSTYGPGDSAQWFIPYVVQEFLAERAPRLTLCDQRWDYLYIDDAVRGIAALGDGSSRGVFNLGFGSARPLKNYVEAIRLEVGSRIQPLYGAVAYRSDQVMHLEADTARLASATGWRPVVGMQEGIRATVAFQKDRLR